MFAAVRCAHGDGLAMRRFDAPSLVRIAGPEVDQATLGPDDDRLFAVPGIDALD
jgi:hypothetical protein